MERFDKYLETAQDKALDWPAIPEVKKPGLGTKIKNFVLDKIGALRGRKIVFFEKTFDGLSPLGEVSFDTGTVDSLKRMVGTEDPIIFEMVWEELRSGKVTNPHIVVSVDDSGKNVVVRVKRSNRSRMGMMKRTEEKHGDSERIPE